MPDGYVVVYSCLLPVFAGGWYLAPCIATTHFLVGIRMRAMASAILLFLLNLIGHGLGPMMTGFMSDWLTPQFGVDSLRYAMSVAVMVNFWCAFHYFMTAETIRKDIAKAPD